MLTKQRPRVVVVEDEPDILEVIQYNLEREGFRVRGAKDGAEGLRRIQQEQPDLILLDLMLPEVDGLSLCRQLKADSRLRSIPVIIVTAKGEIDDLVAGLEAGADDYIPKPFSPKELLARVKAVIRRGSWKAAATRGVERIVIEGVVVDSSRHEALVEGNPIQLTDTQFRLLHFLASHPGQVFTRSHLLDRIMGRGSDVIDRNIDVHVGAIRKKLAQYRGMIETIRGVGYRFEARPVPKP